MTAARPMAGRGIVVTRPAHQSAALAALITSAGGRAIVFPTIAICDVDDRARLAGVIDRLETFDIAIFVSPNAVEKGFAAICERRALPPHLKFAAVGRGSAYELKRQGVSHVISPGSGDDSESLLGLRELREVAGRQIVVFRGVGGRELIRETLEARGARVEYAECYRRAMPHADAGELVSAWERHGIDAFVVTSSEGLRNLCTMLGTRSRERLTRTPVFVTHARVGQAGRELGLQKIILAGTGDAEIAAALSQYFVEAAC